MLRARVPNRWLITLAVVAAATQLAGACSYVPRVRIDAPLNGTFSNATSVTVSGIARGGDPGIALLTVGGISASWRGALAGSKWTSRSVARPDALD